MNRFHTQSLDRAWNPSNSDKSPLNSQTTGIASMSDALKQSISSTSQANVVDPHRDARAIVRLVQCSQCSLPLRDPLTLPCGNALCRKCLPELYTKTNMSFLVEKQKREAFTCPFGGCGKEHALRDCSHDVTLSKVMDRVSIEIARRRPLAIDTPMMLDERPRWRNIVDSSKEERFPSSRVLNGGRLLATYTLAELGELKYDSEVAYQTLSPSGDSYEELDVRMLAHFKEATKNELDCQVCYGLILDPLTTTCGHTFCRKCVARVLDHSTMCPICRRFLPMPPGVQSVPGNKTLAKLLNGLCPDLVAARAEATDHEEIAMSGDNNVPLFVCTLAFPSVPTFLHIFEPRYRLMIRRAIENGNRKFGMITYNQTREAQGDLGNTHFMQYGTLLHINNVQMLPDGRSLIETMGQSRFRVKSWNMLDGYIVGDIERIYDISLTEEEAIEAVEMTGNSPTTNDTLRQISRMSTLELLKVGTDFIVRMQAASAPWLHERVLAAYGSPPDDPALFPFWFASILPIQDEEKYRLLPTTSIRERLKITAGWVRRIEAQRWDERDPSDSGAEEEHAAPRGDVENQGNNATME